MSCLVLLAAGSAVEAPQASRKCPLWAFFLADMVTLRGGTVPRGAPPPLVARRPAPPRPQRQ
jgi:hypothetical protein